VTDPIREFDFPAFKDAFKSKDARRWVQVYAEDAEWIEYKSSAPPRNPVRMVGREHIAAFLSSLEEGDIEISLSDEVLGGSALLSASARNRWFRQFYGYPPTDRKGGIGLHDGKLQEIGCFAGETGEERAKQRHILVIISIKR
jgi:hypothetical protein